MIAVSTQFHKSSQESKDVNLIDLPRGGYSGCNNLIAIRAQIYQLTENVKYELC